MPGLPPSSVIIISITVVIIAALFAFTPIEHNSTQPLADKTYCFQNAFITQSSVLPVANCFAISSFGTFSRVWHEHEDEKPANRVYNSGYVIPGLWDGHGHVKQLGESLLTVQLHGSKNLEDVLQRIHQYMLSHPNIGTRENWILGQGWDQAAFGRMPTADDLDNDEMLRRKYIMLYRVDVHCVWVSNSVLELLPSILPSISGGEILGNSVFCDKAMDIILDKAPKPSKQESMKYIKTAMRKLNQVGIVGVHDAGIFPQEVDLYKEMVETKDWTVRIYAMLECERRNTFCPENAVKINRDDGKLIIRSVKLFSDGALGSWGSSLLEPYSDQPESSGTLLVDPQVLKDLTLQWSQLGFQVNIHAIGDNANRVVVDAFESAFSQLCPELEIKECQKIHRFRIEHAQIIHEIDQTRMFEMGIIPSIQPTHATSDFTYAESRLGDNRTVKEAYRMRSLLPLNPILGSDFPVEPSQPLQGIYAAVTRRSPHTRKGKDGSSNGWYAEESLNVTESLAGFTLAPAVGAFLEGKAGVIQPGAWADWVVLDKLLDQKDLDDILSIKVLETWVSGNRVFQMA